MSCRASVSCFLLQDALFNARNVKESLCPQVSLTLLDLSFNKISTIESLEALTHLQDLSLYHNQISVCENLEGLASLNCLSLGELAPAEHLAATLAVAGLMQPPSISCQYSAMHIWSGMLVWPDFTMTPFTSSASARVKQASAGLQRSFPSPRL